MKTSILENWLVTGMLKTNSTLRNCDSWNDSSKRIKKVWNNGRGLIDFILFDRDKKTIYINSLFASKREIDLCAKFGNVIKLSLGYPEYYSHDLHSLALKNGYEVKL